ncbi:MAG: hypothetical protein KF764_30215 [Labilithrix sp.]|nr:hypothetical protein [Labilithrix sp.]MBX3220529.1 hypothetical protein [Labilithrix sp.]
MSRSEPTTGSRLALAVKASVLFGAVAAVWLSSAACQIGDGDCLRMSDCDTGYTCVEGTCISDTPADAPNTAADAGATQKGRADASTRDAARDATNDASPSDASADGPSTDAS